MSYLSYRHSHLLHLLHVLATAALVLATPLCQAEPDGPLSLNAAYALQSDNNLFRLPSSANVQALTGKSSSAEKIGVTTVGLRFATTQSLQKFEVDASLVDYRYQNFDYLSFAARNYDAAWRWTLTPQLTGNLSSKRVEALNSFADYQGFNQRNQRTDTSNRFDAMLELAGPWRVLAGVSGVARNNEQALVAGGDYRYSAADAGVRYVHASGSTVTLLGRSNSGTYLNQSVPNAGLVDDSFRQTEAELSLSWAYSGNSVLNASLTPIQRSHPTYSQRDFSGLNAAAAWSWAMSGKTRLTTDYAHELAAYATANSNYSQTDRLRVGVQWQAGPKTVLLASHTLAQTDYQGTPTAVAASQRQDTTNDFSLSLGWTPVQGLSLNVALLNARRTSTLAGLDYDSTALTLSGQYSY